MSEIIPNNTSWKGYFISDAIVLVFHSGMILNNSKINPVFNDQSIQPHRRVFALEIQQTDIINRKMDHQLELITPSGAKVTKLFICGALTEIDINSRGAGFIRVADPTGVLNLVLKIKIQEQLSDIKSITIPAFVSITASVESTLSSQKDKKFQLVVESIQLSSRKDRDQWIIKTGHITLLRLKRLSEILTTTQGSEDDKWIMQHYHTGLQKLQDLAGIIAKAVDQVQAIIDAPLQSESNEIETTDKIICEKVLQLIKDQSGPKGVQVQDLIPLAMKLKIEETLLIETIRTLIVEDEIYQPSPGLVKIL